MVVRMETLSKEDLIEILSKAIDQISKLVDENNKLKEELNGTKDL